MAGPKINLLIHKWVDSILVMGTRMPNNEYNPHFQIEIVQSAFVHGVVRR